MFICFGFLALVNAYEFFNNKFIPYMEEKISETKIKKDVAMAKEECTDEGHDTMDADIGADILEPLHSDGNTSPDSEPVVLDGVLSNNSFLVRSADTGYRHSSGPSTTIKENI